MAADPIGVLQTDHRTVERLFEATSQRLDEETVHQIVKELSIHDAIEKEYLYPTIAEAVPGGDVMAQHALEEHQQVAEMLLDIDKRGIDDPDVAGILDQLKRSVTQHVAEEEQQIFPAMQARLERGRLDDLGDKLQNAKKTAPTRPHPHAPSSATGTKVAGAAAAPMDRLKDKVQGRS